MGAIAQGASNVEIAGVLVVTQATVKSRVHAILGKLDLRDRVQAVVFAYESGLVSVGRAG
jgi:DNA-binding NarL/FixJ family response regulator